MAQEIARFKFPFPAHNGMNLNVQQVYADAAWWWYMTPYRLGAAVASQNGSCVARWRYGMSYAETVAPALTGPRGEAVQGRTGRMYHFGYTNSVNPVNEVVVHELPQAVAAPDNVQIERLQQQVDELRKQVAVLLAR